MSMGEDIACGARAAGTTAPEGAVAGGMEKSQVARMPAPEITAVDFQSMLEETITILTFRSDDPRTPPCYDSSCTLSDFLILSTEHFPLHKLSPSSPLDTRRR